MLLAVTLDGGADADAAAPPADDDPLACGGALCNTENGGLCSYSERGLAGESGLSFGLGLVAIGAIAAWRRRAAAATLVAAPLAVASSASAAETEAVNVVVNDPAPEHKDVTLAWNPLSLVTISKLSIDAVITPGEHHAFVVSPYYTWRATEPVVVTNAEGNGVTLPKQHFNGVGAELGYRYYFGTGGPRGLFVGPSLIIGWMEAKAQDATKTHYANLGLAADVGYQMIVGECVALSLGGGLQGMWTTKDIPEQQWPVKVYANRGVSPRVLASVGWAF
jgi:hypothetical protein